MTYEYDLLIAVAFLAPALLFVVLEIVFAGLRADVGRCKPVAEGVPLSARAKPEVPDAANDPDESPLRAAA